MAAPRSSLPWEGRPALGAVAFVSSARTIDFMIRRSSDDLPQGWMFLASAACSRHAFPNPSPPATSLPFRPRPPLTPLPPISLLPASPLRFRESDNPYTALSAWLEFLPYGKAQLNADGKSLTGTVTQDTGGVSLTAKWDLHAERE